jgi:hypothetical protein
MAFNIDQVKLEEIVVLEAVIANPKAIPSLPPDSVLDTEFEMGVGYSDEAKKVRVLFSCKLASSEEPTIQGSFEIAYFFSVENIDELVQFNKEKNTFDLEEPFMSTAINIGYSTSRGIVFNRCLGTVFGKIIFPIVSTSKLMEPFLNSSQK